MFSGPTSCLNVECMDSRKQLEQCPFPGPRPRAGIFQQSSHISFIQDVFLAYVNLKNHLECPQMRILPPLEYMWILHSPIMHFFFMHLRNNDTGRDEIGIRHGWDENVCLFRRSSGASCYIGSQSFLLLSTSVTGWHGAINMQEFSTST